MRVSFCVWKEFGNGLFAERVLCAHLFLFRRSALVVKFRALFGTEVSKTGVARGV